VLFGIVAMLAIFALVRAARGSPWLAAGAAGVMALDNLALVHSRIATLDIYALAAMLAAAILYLRGSAVLAGVALGLAACMKLVALSLVLVLVLLELLRALWEREAGASLSDAVRARAGPTAIAIGAGLVTLVLGIWLLDLLVPAFDPGTRATYAGDPFRHMGHMISYAAKIKAIPNATGISSTPWQWLLDQKPIDYSRVAVNSVAGGKVVASRALFAARGQVNPFIMLVTIPALFAALAAAWYERDRVAALGAAWCLGTFAPFVLESELLDRISYLYYVLIVLPGVYLVTARLFSPSRVPKAATIGWVVALVIGFVDLYPVRSFSGH
jgi:dolichyl-phosphate-mannose--protein O-mannosyl transferase